MSITLLCGGQKSPSQPWRPLPTLDATYPPAPHYASGSRTRHHASPRATPSAVLEHSSELIGCPISRSLTTCCVCLELRSLPSTGVTRLQRYYEPLRHPIAPCPSLAGVRLVIPTTPMGFPCCARFPCVRAAATTPVQRLGVLVARSPSRISLPRKGCRVGLHIDLFEKLWGDRRGRYHRRSDQPRWSVRCPGQTT